LRSALDLEQLPEVTLSILELKKKLVSTIRIDLKAVGLTNKAKEENIEIKAPTNPPTALGALSLPSLAPRAFSIGSNIFKILFPC